MPPCNDVRLGHAIIVAAMSPIAGVRGTPAESRNRTASPAV